MSKQNVLPIQTSKLRNLTRTEAMKTAAQIGALVDVKNAKVEKVVNACPVYQHILAAYRAEDWSKARDFQLETEGNSTWILHNGKGLKLIPGIGGGREKAYAYIEAARQKARKTSGI